MSAGEAPCQLCCLWPLPQRRKWAVCGRGPKVLTGGGRSCQLVCPLQCPRLVHVELLGPGDWEAGRRLLPGQSVHFPRPGPKQKPSEVFPEAHFLLAAQEVVLKWD